MGRAFDRNLDSGDMVKRRQSFWQRIHLDLGLIFIIFLICAFGLLILYSAAGKNEAMLLKQLASIGIGFLVMVAIAQLEPQFMMRWVAPIYLLGLALLIVVEVMGHTAMGATRWINIPGVVRFQPAELMKVVMPMTMAWYLSRHHLPPTSKHIFVSLLLIGIPAALIARQPDLGTALLIVMSGLFVLFLSGLRWRWIFASIAAAAPLLVVMWTFVMRSYQKQRVMTFLNPESDPLGSGWNIIQSKAAIGSGGVSGKGWLMGTQSHLDFLPESHTDFIIAVLAEEFGLLGVALLLFGYLLLISRAIIITVQAQTMFGKLLAGSITLTFFIYIFVNIGMVSGLLPVVGVPLPFVSYGGTSLVTLLAGFGVLMSIHTHRKWITHF